MAISFLRVGTPWELTSANDHADLGTPDGVPEGGLMMIATVVTSNSAAVVSPPAGEGWQNLHTTMQPITNTLRYEYLTWYHGSQGPTSTGNAETGMASPSA
jgi:hypothetical protein